MTAGDANVLHVVASTDLIGHDTTTAEDSCVCGPTTEPVTRDDGSNGWLIIHHSLNDRLAEGERHD